MKSQKQAGAGAHIRLQTQDAFAVQEHIATRDLVIGMTGHDLGQGALAGAVLAHDRVDLAFRHGEVEAVEDFRAADAGAEVFDFERVFHEEVPFER